MKLTDDQFYQLLRPRAGAAVILCAVVFTGWRVVVFMDRRRCAWPNITGDDS